MSFSNTFIWIVCLATGMLFWAILYFKDKTFDSIHPLAKWALGLLRGLSTGILLYLILAPLFKTTFTEIKKPIVVFAQDNSQSISSGWNKEKQASYLADKTNLESALRKDFEVMSFSFGEKINDNPEYDFAERATDISSAFDHIMNQTAGQNLGAVILATDGNFNQGKNPLYSHPSLTIPVFTIGLGDSTIKRDISIQRVAHNNIVYLGDQFEVQVDIKALQCANDKANIQIFRFDGVREVALKSDQLSVSSADWYQTHKFTLDAQQAGTIRYSVRISPLPNEYSKENNVKDFFIDVLDARQKILIAYEAAHPDIATLKKILESNKNYLVETKTAAEIPINISEYSMVIFHQLPSKNNDLGPLLRELNKSKKARMFILGALSDIPRFNANQSLLRINGDAKNMNEVTGEIKESFSLFTPDASWKNYFKPFPPIAAPFGEYISSPGSQTLMTQKIGNISTSYPLILVGEDQGARTAIWCAEGMWKWRYFNYLEQKSFEGIDNLVQKLIQYIGIKEDKRKFRVYTQQKIFPENQPILFDAQLFNDSYEPITTEDVQITITSTDKKDYQFTFNKGNSSYTLNAGLFAPGTYQYTAFVTSKTGRQEVKGQFIVQKIQLETYQNTADHNLLKLLASEKGGKFLGPDQLSSLVDLIKQNNGIKPIQYSSQRTYPIINFRWIFALLAGLICIEWFLRRYWGSY